MADFIVKQKHLTLTSLDITDQLSLSEYEALMAA